MEDLINFPSGGYSSAFPELLDPSSSSGTLSAARASWALPLSTELPACISTPYIQAAPGSAPPQAPEQQGHLFSFQSFFHIWHFAKGTCMTQRWTVLNASGWPSFQDLPLPHC